MDKADFVVVLENHGFSAVEENGVVMVLCEGGEFRKTAAAARQLARLSGYANSLGFRTKGEHEK